MSHTALTVPGKWSSYNSSMFHAMTRHSSFKSPRYEPNTEPLSHSFGYPCHTGKNNAPGQTIEEKYPLVHLSERESQVDKTIKTDSLTLPKLVGKPKVLNRFYASGGQQPHTTQEKMTDKYSTNTLGIRVPGSHTDRIDEYKILLRKTETEKKELQKQINALYGENRSLRMSIDSADKPGIDSYRQVLQDRQLLREAEDKYKKRIAKLEKELKDVQKTCQTLTEENKKLKEGLTKHTEKLENQSKYNNLYWKWNALKKENEKFRMDIEILSKLGSRSDVKVVLGRGLDILDSIEKSKQSGKLQNNSVYEERNALKIDNRKLKEETEKLRQQISQQREGAD